MKTYASQQASKKGLSEKLQLFDYQLIIVSFAK